jgi:hypothetical protein
MLTEWQETHTMWCVLHTTFCTFLTVVQKKKLEYNYRIQHTKLHILNIADDKLLLTVPKADHGSRSFRGGRNYGVIMRSWRDVKEIIIFYRMHKSRADNPLLIKSNIAELRRSQWPRGLRPLGCWGRGFESRSGHGCLSVVFICCVVLCM